MSKLVSGLLVFVCLLLLPAQASAHVLVVDEAGDQGLVLHIDPDDDPVGGRAATLFFDVQDLAAGFASLDVTDAAGGRVNVPVAIDGHTVLATYTFPSQGVYRLDLQVGAGGKQYAFSYAQRISRGVSGAAAASEPFWADLLVYSGGAGLVTLAALAGSRWKRIAQQSVMKRGRNTL